MTEEEGQEQTQLEEVELVQPNPQQVAVLNPPSETDETPEESEEVVEEDETSNDPEENPKGLLNKASNTVSGLTQDVGLTQMLGGAVGVVAAITVPRVTKFVTGWKDLLATAVTTALGGFFVGKLDKGTGVAFVIGSGGVFMLKAAKWAMGGFQNEKILLDDLTPGGGQPVLGEDEFDFDSGPLYDAAEGGLFDDLGDSDDVLHPTASGIDDFS